MRPHRSENPNRRKTGVALTPRIGFVVALVFGVALFAVFHTGSDRDAPAAPTTYYESTHRTHPVLLVTSPASMGFDWPLICEMTDGTPVPKAIVRVSLLPRRLGVDPVVVGQVTTDDTGYAQFFIPLGDGEAPPFGCAIEAVHPTISGLIARERSSLSPPRGRTRRRDEPPATKGLRRELIQRVRFDLEQLGVEGEVVDEAGIPVANALVAWAKASGQPAMETGVRTTAHGLCSLSHHPALKHLTAQARDHHPETRLVGESRGRVRFVMRRRPMAKGRIVDAHGEPIAGARVTCGVMGTAREGETPRPPSYRWDRWLSRGGYSESGPNGSVERTWIHERNSVTDDQGQFAVPFGTTGRGRVVVRAAGREIAVRELDADRSGWDFGDVDVRASDLHQAYGRLVSADGRAIEGARLTFTIPPLDSHQTTLATRTTDAAGRFSLSGLRDGDELVVTISVHRGGGVRRARGRHIQHVKIRPSMIVRY